MLGASTSEPRTSTASTRATGRQSLVFAADQRRQLGGLRPARARRQRQGQARFSPGATTRATCTARSSRPRPRWSTRSAPTARLRLTYNEAFQVPNYSEFFLQAPVAAPIPLRLAVLAATGTDLQAALCSPFGVDCGLDVVPILALGNADLAGRRGEDLRARLQRDPRRQDLPHHRLLPQRQQQLHHRPDPAAGHRAGAGQPGLRPLRRAGGDPRALRQPSSRPRWPRRSGPSASAADQQLRRRADPRRRSPTPTSATSTPRGSTSASTSN